MSQNSSIVAICGAGIAGVALAYYLSKNKPHQKIILIDKGQPLSFTTSKSGENFRNYWPHPCMEQLSTRSIVLMLALLEEFGKDAFDMRFSGYHFLSHQKEKPIFSNDNSEDFRRKNILETNPQVIHNQYPYLDKEIQKSIFIKKAGDIDVYALGSLLLRKAKKSGLHILTGELCTLYISETNELPEYAPYFHPERYKNTEVMDEINRLPSDGQL